MKRQFIAAISALLLIGACSPRQQVSSETEIADYADSSATLMFNLDVELPVASDEVNAAVRADLIQVLCSELENLANDNTLTGLISEVNDSTEVEYLVTTLGSKAFQSLKSLSEEDAREWQRASDDLPEEYPFQWECICNLTRALEADNYWVYLSENYEYLGGAHGGVTGAGYLTYSKADGSRITGFIDPDQLEAIQPLLRAGIVSYFSENEDDLSEEEALEYLFIEDGIIPLPVQDPYPSEDGLNFIYQQYEIAPYAMGMPSFTIPFDQIKPYLTEQTRKALDL